MHQSIQEKVSVAGVYAQAKFIPYKFKWRNREYLVEKITFTHDVKDGGIKKRRFSVLNLGNLYRLCFDRDNEIWMLEEIYCD